MTLICMKHDCPSRNKCARYVTEKKAGQSRMVPDIDNGKCIYFETKKSKTKKKK